MKTQKIIKTTFILMFTLNVCASEAPIQSILGQGGTGFTINGIRNFEIAESTVFKEDGVINPVIRGQGGTGFKVRYKVGDDVNLNITGGTLTEIDFINTHKGPVLSKNPLKIFNIDALITADTIFTDNTTLDDINIGDELKVSGFIDSNSSLLISRIELTDEPLTEWKLSGFISLFNTTEFNLENQVISIGGVIEDNCDFGLADGLFVEVKANSDPLFVAGSPLTSVTSIECVEEGITTLPGDVIPVALEGFVDYEEVALNNFFTISGQRINIIGSTEIENGDIDDIILGAKVEVEGLMNTTTSFIDAFRVKFEETRFEFTEPLHPNDVIIGQSIQLFGQTIFASPQVRDEDNILSDGIVNEIQVEVKGYADSGGTLIATRIREKGDPDINDVDAEGEITSISSPNFEIFGIQVDTSGSLFFDRNDNPISSIEFFTQATIGTEVEVEMATVNETTNIISGGVVKIDEDADEVANEDGFKYQSTGADGTPQEGLGIGTVTSLQDNIFNNSFE